MWISRVKLENVRCFKDRVLELSRGINLLVGPNNGGKSTILHAIRLLQYNNALLKSDIRVGNTEGSVTIVFGESPQKYLGASGDFVFMFRKMRRQVKQQDGSMVSVNPIPSVEPDNFIYPYLSKRKVAKYQEEVNVATVSEVSGTLSNLYSKIDRIANPEFLPAHAQYMKACDDILNFRVMSTPSEGGKKASYTIRNIYSIPLDAMGEGVANLLGLIVDLCIAEDKLFLIEEPENDIHPKALKGLLKLIAEKAENNQFVITTHSNIVTKYLGAETGSKVFSVQTQFVERIPTSEVVEINTFDERREILELLGYELSDFDLWDSWLLLEESSAEKIIREFLIPEYVPSLLSKLKTFSGRTISEVEIKFDDFNRLFTFLNMQPTYKDRAWVIVDAGHDEEEVIQKLKQTYIPSGWDESHFQQFVQHDFERYYPACFQEQVDTVLALKDKQAKRERKQALLTEVETWIKENRQEARAAFRTSASEVIDKLRAIEKHLKKARH